MGNDVVHVKSSDDVCFPGMQHVNWSLTLRAGDDMSVDKLVKVVARPWIGIKSPPVLMLYHCEVTLEDIRQ